MGFRFSLEHANWLAHILQPLGATPQLEHDFERRETLRQFLERIESNYYASPQHLGELGNRLREAIHTLSRSNTMPREALGVLRDYFRDIPWVALIIPSGANWEIDSFLTDRDLLRELVHIRLEEPGLILQLDHVPEREIALEHVFPAFKIALAEITRWPGVLFWTPQGDAAFFQLSKDIRSIRERLHWLFSHLATAFGPPDLALLRRQYEREMPPVLFSNTDPLRIIHLSDIHLGSKVAQRRLPRVKRLIRSAIDELGETLPIVPVVTGDLMDSPSDSNLDEVRSFMEFLSDLGTEEPVVVLGNHDVRRDGWLNPLFEQAIHIARDRVVWIDQSSVGFTCFNSVRDGGNLASGRIGEREFADVGDALDRDPHRSKNYTLLALVHHHPIPVEVPSWYRRAWYERLLGAGFERTEELEDAEIFLEWLRLRKVTAVLHGHKHIPRFNEHNGISIIGCGSSVGKVDTQNRGQTYMSLNIVTIDAASGQLSCRLRVERIPGAGLESSEMHEIIYKERLVA